MRAQQAGRIAILAVATLALVASLALYFAPYTIPEITGPFSSYDIVDPVKPALGAGRMVDEYWAVQPIDANTTAIGEPRYYQQNYAYLIVGEHRALLFDAGSGTRDNIIGIVASLTRLPVTVLASHLHFDHTGGIKPFTSIAMIDLPETRADVTNGQFTPGRYEYHGMRDGLKPPTFTVTEWLMPGATIDLGGRKIRVNSVHPGPIDTDMIAFRTPEQREERLKQVPMHRHGTAEEVAQLVAFLLSDESSYITGAEIAIDGASSA